MQETNVLRMVAYSRHESSCLVTAGEAAYCMIHLLEPILVDFSCLFLVLLIVEQSYAETIYGPWALWAKSLANERSHGQDITQAPL